MLAPGETFPVRIDLPLLRPLGAAGGPAVEVQLDGVLFDDLSFYGPDKLHSAAHHDGVGAGSAARPPSISRSCWKPRAREGLQKEMLDSLARQADRPQPGVQMVRGRVDQRRSGARSAVRVPAASRTSPVEPTGGMAQHRRQRSARAALRRA